MDSLSKVFGYDHVTINVRANINFDEIVQKIEKYDPKGTLVSSEKHSDIAKKVDGTSTEPGTSANGEVPNYNTSTASNGVLSEDKEDLIENFDVGKTVETIKQNPELTNLNVVVWIDKTMQANEISTISKAVAVSAGLKDTNNDGVYENGEVQVIPVFFNQNLQKSQNQQAETEKGLLETLFGSKLTAMIVFGIIGLAFVLLTIFVILARRKGKETDGEGNIVSKRKIVSKETINQNDVTNINNIREINNEERTMDENLLTKISDAKKKAVVIEGDEDSETVKRQKTITEKAKEVAGKDPQKTSEFIKKLISEG
jgi:flagellar biosynthesis/type III secretory pathway M-ring protein FliF/YscJ